MSKKNSNQPVTKKKPQPGKVRPTRKGQHSEQAQEAKAKVIEAMKRCQGIKTAACEEAGITRVTLNNWEKADPDFAAQIADLASIERKKDFVEAALLKLVAAGDAAATIFASKCLNKDRGYVEKKEVAVTTPGPFMLLTSQPAAPPEPGIPS